MFFNSILHQYSCHNETQVVAFHLTLAIDLYALKISTCFSWASHINFNRKKKNVTKKTEFIEHVLHKHLASMKRKKRLDGIPKNSISSSLLKEQMPFISTYTLYVHLLFVKKCKKNYKYEYGKGSNFSHNQ